MIDAKELRWAYDRQLRTDAETANAVEVIRLGCLHLAKFSGGHGFVTYPHPEGTDVIEMPHLVTRVLEHYRKDPTITQVEWKTRGHDYLPGLPEALQHHGFWPDAPESIMVGEAQRLDVELALPPGVTLRRLSGEGEVRAMVTMQDRVFGRTHDHMVENLLERMALQDGMQLWVAEVDGQIVGAGRIEPVAGTDFAGIWGGSTMEGWRHRGIYRALTAVRARAARAMGKTLIHSDSTEYSRPILERSGLIQVSTTTPYHWHR